MGCTFTMVPVGIAFVAAMVLVGITFVAVEHTKAEPFGIEVAYTFY